MRDIRVFAVARISASPVAVALASQPGLNVTAVIPAFGSVAGGSIVKIVGTGFNGSFPPYR